ncbi:MAG: hypothetical protein AB4426_10680 [Xenococcaceae cyanobacterium]
MTAQQLPKLSHLPSSLPQEGAISIELQEGVPIFRASKMVQKRIEQLLSLQQESGLTSEQEEELDSYEEIADYLSLVNRTIRNLY